MQYQPLKWPPEYSLVQLHYKTCIPGKQNIQGNQCPCCHKYERLPITTWFTKSVYDDFKRYGGGVTGYFHLAAYLILSYFVITMISCVAYIVILNIACYEIQLIDSDSKLLPKCITFFGPGGLLFNEPQAIIQALYDTNLGYLANTIRGLQFCTFIIMIGLTIGMKFYFYYLRNSMDDYHPKLFSKYALIFKDIPRYYTLEQLTKDILALDPKVKICEIFFLYPMDQYETIYRKVFDKYYQLKFVEEQIQVGQNKDQNQKLLQKLYLQYLKDYEQLKFRQKNIKQHSGRAIVVFQTPQSRKIVKQKLKINPIMKKLHRYGKLLGINMLKNKYFIDRPKEPCEIYWKYIGERDINKIKFEAKTSAIAILFIIITFIVFYYPMIKADQEKILDPSVGTWLSLLLSLIVLILNMLYRWILLQMMPLRKPSNKHQQSFFILSATVIIHLLFYLLVPMVYYLIPIQIPKSVRLLQSFSSVALVDIFQIIVSLFNIRYRIYNGKRNRILKGDWRKMCQMRAHEELKYPSFPIELKLMLLYNIWSFNAYYVFFFPYLPILSFFILLIVYFMDKRLLYTRYRMHNYQSMQIQVSFQSQYVVLFMICSCFGYAIAAYDTWQIYMAVVIFIIGVGLNFLIDYANSLTENKKIDRTLTFAQMRKHTSLRQSIFREQFEEHLLKNNESFIYGSANISLESMVFIYGYKQLYDQYLKQFHNQTIQQNLYMKFELIKQFEKKNGLSVFNAIQNGESQREVTQMQNMSAKNDQYGSQDKQKV